MTSTGVRCSPTRGDYGDEYFQNKMSKLTMHASKALAHQSLPTSGIYRNMQAPGDLHAGRHVGVILQLVNHAGSAEDRLSTAAHHGFPQTCLSAAPPPPQRAGVPLPPP